MKRLIVGRRAVAEALEARAGAIAVLYVAEREEQALQPLAASARRAGVRVERKAQAELAALAGELRHQGVIAVAGDYPYVSLETLTTGGPAPVIVALDQIQDPHNFGAIVRTAVALGAQGIITMKDRACPVTAAVVRASAGATEHARIARVTNLGRALATLASRDMQVVGLSGDGDVTLADLPTTGTGRVIVIGSEGRGLRRLVRTRCQYIARIDLPGPIASLNAAVAAGIALHASCH